MAPNSPDEQTGAAHVEPVDLLTFGTNCAHPSCNQLDFLPFQCDCCKQVYCLEHRTYSSHACAHARADSADTILCPMCARAIRLGPGEGANEAWERHQREGCDTSNYAKVHKKPRCPAPGCKEKLNTVNSYRCKDCGTTVCLKHRFGTDHKCEEQRAAAKAERSSWWAQVGSFKSQQQRPSSNRQTSQAPPVSTQAVRHKPSQPARNQPQPLHNTLAGTASRRMRELPEQCQHCGAKFADVEALIRHSEEYHQQAARPSGGQLEVCPQCGKGFSNAVKLVQHVQHVHNPSPADGTSYTARLRRFFGQWNA